MVDAGLRLLCLANQLDELGIAVELDFEEGERGTMGYLDRMGFFDYLRPGVYVFPSRPVLSSALLYHGTNRSLVEIIRIKPSDGAEDIPSRLADTLERSVKPSPGVPRLGRAAFTVFAELIDNIFQHSNTVLDAFAALQVYRQGGRAKVVVSDSGAGILNTLRPTLRPPLSRLKDSDLIVETFRRGVSRHGKVRGCGLKASADHALRYNAELDVRLATSRVHLVPSPDGYLPNMAYCQEGLFPLQGTHICFDFRLDM